MWGKINEMPGLKQLKKFAQDIDALGNEANRRVEKSETLPIVDFPTNISEADDSEEFIFGLPEQSDSNASENIDSGYTITNCSNIKLQSCKALSNTNYGFNLDCATNTALDIKSCTADYNGNIGIRWLHIAYDNRPTGMIHRIPDSHPQIII